MHSRPSPDTFRFHRALPLGVLLALAVCAFALFPSRAHAQVIAEVIGTVTDTLGRPLRGATVVASGAHGDSVVARTDSAGSYRLQLPVELADTAIVLSARQLGFGSASIRNFEAPSGATRRVAFRLVPAPTNLGSVEVSGKRGSPLASRGITAADFDPKRVHDALDLLARYRPSMLGDPFRCPDMMNGFSIGQPPRAMPIERIYVNGVRRDRPGQEPFGFGGVVLPRNASVTGAVQAVLEELPPEDIAEIRFADCWDRTVPIDRRNALFVVLKPHPLTKKEQQALRELMRPGTDTTARTDSTTSTKSTNAQTSGH